MAFANALPGGVAFDFALGRLTCETTVALTRSADAAEEHARWSKRNLSAKRYVYFWVDGIHVHYDFPAEQWKHLRTTNVIESSFATVRHRTVRSKGCLSTGPRSP